MSVRRFSLVLLLSTVLAPRFALAQEVSEGDKAAARQLTIDGYSALDRKDYAGAADKFRRASTLIQVPTVTLGLARAQVGLGKLVSAQESYNRLIREPLAPGASPALTKAVEDGRTELAALEPRIPSLIINVQGADAPKVTLDGVDVAAAVLGNKRPVDPGKHLIRAVAPGLAPHEASVTVSEGQVETVNIDLRAAPQSVPDRAVSGSGPVAGPGPGPLPGGDAGSSAGSVQKPVGFGVLGVGAAGLVAGAVATGLASSKHSDLIRQCPTGHCPESLQPQLGSEVNDYRTLGGVAVGGFVAGAALAAAGVILVVTAPASKAHAAFVSPIIGPGFVGAAGRF